MKKKFELMRQAFALLSKERKRKQIVIWCMAVVGSGLELLCVSIFYPLAQLIIAPEGINQNKLMNAFCLLFNLKTERAQIAGLILGLIILYFVKNLYLSFEIWCINNNSYTIREEIISRLMKRYMNSPYLFFVTKNSAELQRNITVNASSVCLFFQCFMQIIVEIFVCLLLGLYLFKINPFLTIVTLALLLGIGTVYFVRSKKNLYIYGKRNQENSKKLLQWMGESIGGIKEIKITGREEFFIRKIQKICAGMKKDETWYTTLTQVPRYFVESICITSVLGTSFVQLMLGVEKGTLIPQLAAFAVAAFRLLPSVGKINGLLGNLQFHTPAIKELYEELNVVNKENEAPRYRDNNINFEEKIELKDVSFSYDGKKDVLNKVNVLIPKNNSVAFIGPSGAGKTTLADVVLGLIKVKEGNIYIDHVDVTKGGYERGLFGYIPQNIFLSDDTIRNNVAFGIQDEEIDDAKIWEALEEAQLADFVKSLPDQLDAVVGERGAKISGGQRQRIGIARALYANPAVLVMDEATSALDTETEKMVMESIVRLRGRRTLIIIAHRLSTVEECDIIYEVKEGQVTDITQKFKEDRK